jgi:hypothetical protein
MLLAKYELRSSQSLPDMSPAGLLITLVPHSRTAGLASGLARVASGSRFLLRRYGYDPYCDGPLSRGRSLAPAAPWAL